MKAKSQREFLVSLTGGLGNQLFQIAHALVRSNYSSLHLVQEFGRPRINELREAEIFSFLLPFEYTKGRTKEANLLMRKILGHTLKVSEHPEKWERSKIYKFLCRALANLVLTIYYQKLICVSTNAISFDFKTTHHASTLFLGYFQKMSDIDIDAIRGVLRPISLETASEQLQHEIDYALNNQITILHIRLTDYFHEPKIGLLSAEYFERALIGIDFSQLNNEIWVFSDDHVKAESILKFPSYVKVRFISEKAFSVAETFELMRYGNQYILSNSTFGWWSAFLCKKESSNVVVPYPWFKDLNYDSSLFVPGWKKERAQWRNDLFAQG